MRLAKVAPLAVVLMLLVTLVRWDAPVREDMPGKRPGRSAVPPPAPRPEMTRRAAWGADEELVRERASPVNEVRAVFIHHTNHANTYDCADVPGLLRALQRDHVRRMGWDDIGYNFVVDRCGTVYEGRAGGAGRPVLGAHTGGFNTQSAGIGVIGDFGAGAPVPHAAREAIAAVAAWQLRPGTDPRERVRLESTNSQSRFRKGSTAVFAVISGHRDSYETSCPGDALYAELPRLRDEVARVRARDGTGPSR